MKVEYYLNVIQMLTSQLTEEEEQYEQALAHQHPDWQLSAMEQRIMSLRNSLFSLNRWQETIEARA